MSDLLGVVITGRHLLHLSRLLYKTLSDRVFAELQASFRQLMVVPKSDSAMEVNTLRPSSRELSAALFQRFFVIPNLECERDTLVGKAYLLGEIEHRIENRKV
ncbi:MAG: hypothetical protein U5J62_05415 [Desulfurivibrio sp.]|nr:hypothetical protein [Desulfurivibrio sp.]